MKSPDTAGSTVAAILVAQIAVTSLFCDLKKERFVMVALLPIVFYIWRKYCLIEVVLSEVEIDLSMDITVLVFMSVTQVFLGGGIFAIFLFTSEGGAAINRVTGID